VLLSARCIMSLTGSSYGYAKARTSTIDLLSVSSSEPDTSEDKTGGKDGLTPPLKSTGLEMEEEEEEEDDDDSVFFVEMENNMQWCTVNLVITSPTTGKGKGHPRKRKRRTKTKRKGSHCQMRTRIQWRKSDRMRQVLIIRNGMSSIILLSPNIKKHDSMILHPGVESTTGFNMPRAKLASTTTS
jgi:hypothetical protein